MNNTLWLLDVSYSNTLCLSNFPYLDMNSVHVKCIVGALLSICSLIFTMSNVIWIVHVMDNPFMWSSNLPYSYMNLVHIESIDFALLLIFSPIFNSCQKSFQYGCIRDYLDLWIQSLLNPSGWCFIVYN
jgi:hypothetical protein